MRRRRLPVSDWEPSSPCLTAWGVQSKWNKKQGVRCARWLGKGHWFLFVPTLVHTPTGLDSRGHKSLGVACSFLVTLFGSLGSHETTAGFWTASSDGKGA